MNAPIDATFRKPHAEQFAAFRNRLVGRASSQDSHSNLSSQMDNLRRYAGAVTDGRAVVPIRTMVRLSQIHC